MYFSARAGELPLKKTEEIALALRGLGPESEAESVRFHGRRVTQVDPEVKAAAGGLGGLSFTIRRAGVHVSVLAGRTGLPVSLRRAFTGCHGLSE